jgi:hypothetical protein
LESFGAGVGDADGLATWAAFEIGGDAATLIAASASAASSARKRSVGGVVVPRDMHALVPVVGRSANGKSSGGLPFR